MNKKLYTIQNIKVLNQINKNGFYLNKNKILYKDFTKAYNWLMTKLSYLNWKSKRPIWCWEKRPDLRQYRYFYDKSGPHFEELVLIELNVDRKDLFVMDYDTWHCVLNNCFYSEKAKDFDLFYKKYEKNGKITKKGQIILENSWIRCLRPKKTDIKQVVIEKITKDQIVSTKIFKSKNKF